MSVVAGASSQENCKIKVFYNILDDHSRKTRQQEIRLLKLDIKGCFHFNNYEFKYRKTKPIVLLAVKMKGHQTDTVPQTVYLSALLKTYRG